MILLPFLAVAISASPHFMNYECSRLDARILNAVDPVKCALLDVDCLKHIPDLVGVNSDCISNIKKENFRVFTPKQAASTLNGNAGRLGKYGEFPDCIHVTLLKCLNGRFELLLPGYKRLLWLRPSLTLSVLDSLPNDQLGELIDADAFEFGPVFLSARMTTDVWFRLPDDVLSRARPDMVASLPPPCLSSLSATRVFLAQPLCFSKLTYDQVLIIPDACIAVMDVGQVAGLIGADTQSTGVRLWRAALAGPARVKQQHVNWLLQHPCRALQSRLSLFHASIRSVVIRDCRVVWNGLELLEYSYNTDGNSNKSQDHVFSSLPIIFTIVMGVVMMAFLVQICVLTLNEYN